MRDNKRVFCIAYDCMCIVVPDSMCERSDGRTKNRCVLANTAAEKRTTAGFKLELQLHAELNDTRRTQIEHSSTRQSAEPVVIGLGGIID